VAVLFGVEEAALLEEAGWPRTVSPDRPLKESAAALGSDVQALRDALKRLTEGVP